MYFNYLIVNKKLLLFFCVRYLYIEKSCYEDERMACLHGKIALVFRPVVCCLLHVP